MMFCWFLDWYFIFLCFLRIVHIYFSWELLMKISFFSREYLSFNLACTVHQPNAHSANVTASCYDLCKIAFLWCTASSILNIFVGGWNHSTPTWWSDMGLFSLSHLLFHSALQWWKYSEIFTWQCILLLESPRLSMIFFTPLGPGSIHPKPNIKVFF